MCSSRDSECELKFINEICANFEIPGAWDDPCQSLKKEDRVNFEIPGAWDDPCQNLKTTGYHNNPIIETDRGWDDPSASLIIGMTGGWDDPSATDKK